MIREPKAMEEIHKIREELYKERKKMAIGKKIEAINKNTEQLLKGHGYRLVPTSKGTWIISKS